jgi:hypothetical protein
MDLREIPVWVQIVGWVSLAILYVLIGFGYAGWYVGKFGREKFDKDPAGGLGAIGWIFVFLIYYPCAWAWEFGEWLGKESKPIVDEIPPQKEPPVQQVRYEDSPKVPNEDSPENEIPLSDPRYDNHGNYHS